MIVKVVYSEESDKNYHLRFVPTEAGGSIAFSGNLQFEVRKESFGDKPAVGDEFELGFTKVVKPEEKPEETDDAAPEA